MEEQLKKELSEAFPGEQAIILGLIDKALESEKSCLLSDGEWNLSLDVEKQHSLQFYYYMAISKEVPGSDDIEISVSYENGINNGTQIIDYCLEGGSMCSPTQEIEVIIGIKPDWDQYKVMLEKSSNPEFLKRKIEAVIKYREAEILKLYKDQNYDNYVTGGGSGITDSHYRNAHKKLHDRNIFWLPVYEVIEADRVFV